MPPRHGKSLHSSVYFPAWYLGLHPNNRVIACSYSADLSHAFSRQCRNLVLSPQFGEIFRNPAVTNQTVEVASDSRSVAMWDLAAPNRGGYVSAGVGGSITGKGASLLVIDDYLKDIEQAKSSTILQNVWDWYTSTAYTRLEGEAGAVILIATRWSEDDLIGRVLRQAEDKGRLDEWTVLTLPGVAEEDDPLGREPGEPLWPEKFGKVYMDDMRFTLGEQQFAALIQQRPAPAEGLYIKKAWLKHYDKRLSLPRFRRVIQAWDTAFKDGRQNDYSACVTFGMLERPLRRSADSQIITMRRSHDLWLLDAFRDKLEFPDLIKAIEEQYLKWEEILGYHPSEILIEDKASGTPAYQSLRLASDMPVRAVKVDRDKINRVNAITPWYEQGRIYHPDSAPWREQYEHDLMTFPGIKHDDWIDATTMAVERLLGSASASAFLGFMRDQVNGLASSARAKNEITLPAGIQSVNSM